MRVPFDQQKNAVIPPRIRGMLLRRGIPRAVPGIPPLNNGGTAYNGIYALAQEDTNKDGVVNNLDANWNTLKIWKDLNSDGISQSEELFSLEQMGITGLATKATNYTYTYTKADGTTGVMADVHSAVDTFHQQFTEAIPVLPDVEVLPDMQGSGLV
ncbi:MAG: hypothetical protein QMD11_09665, partial [Smithella sp.]|nr:hypothetical protein [Smithella sp.]